MHPGENERRPEARLLRWRRAERRSLPRQRLKPPSQVRQHLVLHSRTHAAGIDEPAVVSVVAKQQRAEMRPRPFRVGPADYNEFLPIETFRFAPQASISGRVGRIDRLRHDAFQTKFAGFCSSDGSQNTRGSPQFTLAVPACCSTSPASASGAVAPTGLRVFGSPFAGSSKPAKPAIAIA
jgi:hypothetical protein